MQAGVTQQQLLRKKFGILVTHKAVGDAFTTNVIKDGKVVAVFPDDCLASGTVFVGTKIFAQFAQGMLLDYPSATGSACIAGKIADALQHFDFTGFEKNILPTLHKEAGLAHQIEVYQQTKGKTDDGSVYMLYDALYRIFLYMRFHNKKLERHSYEDLEAVEFNEAMSRGVRNVACVLVQQEFEERALQSVCPEGKFVDDEGDKLFIVDNTIDPFTVGKGSYFKMEPIDWQVSVVSAAPVQREIAETGFATELVEDSLWHDLASQVFCILPRAQQRLSEKDREFVNYGLEFIGQGKAIGANALRGLGKIARDGPLVEAIKQVAGYIKDKAGSSLTLEQCARLAAAKLARMQSVKEAYRGEQGLYLRDISKA